MKRALLLLIFLVAMAMFAQPAKSDCIACQAAITAPAAPSYSIVPDTDNSYDLGSATFEWKDLYVDGVAYIDHLALGATSSMTASERLYLKAGDDGISITHPAETNFVLEDSDNSFIGFGTPTSKWSGLYFNEGTDPDGDQFKHYNTGAVGLFRWVLGGVDTMQLNETGLSIGATSQTASESLYVKVNDDGLAVSSDSGQKVIIENSTSAFLGFRVGNSQSSGLRFNAGTDPDGGRFQHSFDGADSHFAWTLDGETQMRLYDQELQWADQAAAATYTISPATSDADDDATVQLLGGGGAASSRGAYITAKGNEASGAGDLNLNSGNASGSNVIVTSNASNGDVEIRAGGGVNHTRFNDDGSIEMQVTGAGIILISPDGTDSLCTVDNSDNFSCTGL